MEIFLDTASVKEIRETLQWGISGSIDHFEFEMLIKVLGEID